MSVSEIESPTVALVRAASAGDRDAFADLVRRERAALVRAARAILGDRHEAEDAAQEAFVAAYAHLPELRDPERFRPWLLRILARIAVRRRERLRRRKRLDGEDRVPARPEGGDPRLDALAAAVESLPDKYRTLVSLHYLADLSYEEVAEATGLSVGRVRSRLHQARELLRRRIEDERA